MTDRIVITAPNMFDGPVEFTASSDYPDQFNDPDRGPVLVYAQLQTLLNKWEKHDPKHRSWLFVDAADSVVYVESDDDGPVIHTLYTDEELYELTLILDLDPEAHIDSYLDPRPTPPPFLIEQQTNGLGGKPYAWRVVTGVTGQRLAMFVIEADAVEYLAKLMDRLDVHHDVSQTYEDGMFFTLCECGAKFLGLDRDAADYAQGEHRDAMREASK